jgi:hypothetical protein
MAASMQEALLDPELAAATLAHLAFILARLTSLEMPPLGRMMRAAALYVGVDAVLDGAEDET